MPAFVFRGGPECGVDSVVMYGLLFPVGVAVEVTDDAVAAKLAGNMYFAEAGASPSPDVHTVVKRRGRPPRL